LAAEGKRVAQLQQLGNMLKVPQEVIAKAIADNKNVIDAKGAFLTHLAANATPVHSVKVGEDRNRASLVAAIPEAIMLRAGLTVARTLVRSGQFSELALLDLFRQYLASVGVPADKAFGMGRVALSELLGPRRFRQAFPQIAMLAQSTSDFDSILE